MHPLPVDVDDTLMNAPVQVIGIGEDTVGQVRLLEVPPVAFDVVEFRGSHSTHSHGRAERAA